MFFVFYLVKYKKEVVIRKMELRELELGYCYWDVNYVSDWY